MEIIFLGTSCMQPTKERNHPGILINFKGEGLLFDCGEGIQRQIRIAGIKPTSIRKIFLTHWDGDHSLGIMGLLQTIASSDNPQNVEIYGPQGTEKKMELLTQVYCGKIDYMVKEVSKGKVLDADEYEIFSDELRHGTKCVGYSFIEKDRRRINLKEAKKLGIPEGPLLGKLQGGETIMFKGKKVKPEDVTSIIKGRKIAYVTDTRPCEGAIKLANKADILIIESTYGSELEDKAKEFLHLTAKEAALIANEANAKKLILTHFSQRYKKASVLEEDARDIFDNTMAAEDFLRIKL